MENGITLLCGTEIPAGLIFEPIAQIAGRGGAIFVVDGENSFRSYPLAHYARAMRLEPHRALANVHVARAFTCYQLTELVTRLGRCVDLDGAGIVCLGLLGTFYDEDVPLPEARRLLQQAIVSIKVLSGRWPVLITVRPPPPQARHRIGLVHTLMQNADAVHILKASPPGASVTQRLLLPPSTTEENRGRHGTHE